MPSPYYAFHEAEYAKRLRAGRAGWDAGDYDDFFMRPFVARSLVRSAACRPGNRALDLGCGTGALSCQLAEAGLDVTGVDISSSAIAAAQAVAARRRLPITFAVHDVCRQPLPSGGFDLIVDGHLLHCIVFEDERQRLLGQVRRSLNAGGEFWVETMLLESDREPNPVWNLDGRGVVWTRSSDAAQCAEAVRRDGAWWMPQRLIARSREGLLSEFRSAGLHPIEHECYDPVEPGVPGGFRARFTAAAAG